MHWPGLLSKNQPLLAIITYLFLIAAALFSLHLADQVDLLSNSSFLHWDANYYHLIASVGYQGEAIAFFPLFPLLWRLTGFGAVSIALLNGFIYLFSFYALARVLTFNFRMALLGMVIPSALFYFLPFSEAIFLTGCIPLIVGLKQNKNWLIILGLFVVTLARPAFTILLPALIITELATKSFDRKSALRILGYLLVSVSGTFLVAVLQFTDTGEWFKFFGIQREWDNKLQWPMLPFHSWDDRWIVLLDASAFMVGVVAGVIALIAVLKKWIPSKISLPREVLFSLLYLGGITLSVLLFRGGGMNSLNRYIYATPFMLVGLHFWTQYPLTLNTKQLVAGFILLLSAGILFGAYVHIQELLRFTFWAALIWLLLAIKSGNRTVSSITYYLLIVASLCIQVLLFHRFLNGDWVG